MAQQKIRLRVHSADELANTIYALKSLEKGPSGVSIRKRKNLESGNEHALKSVRSWINKSSDQQLVDYFWAAHVAWRVLEPIKEIGMSIQAEIPDGEA